MLSRRSYPNNQKIKVKKNNFVNLCVCVCSLFVKRGGICNYNSDIHFVKGIVDLKKGKLNNVSFKAGYAFKKKERGGGGILGNRNTLIVQNNKLIFSIIRAYFFEEEKDKNFCQIKNE